MDQLLIEQVRQNNGIGWLRLFWVALILSRAYFELGLFWSYKWILLNWKKIAYFAKILISYSQPLKVNHSKEVQVHQQLLVQTGKIIRLIEIWKFQKIPSDDVIDTKYSDNNHTTVIYDL